MSPSILIELSKIYFHYEGGFKSFLQNLKVLYYSGWTKWIYYAGPFQTSTFHPVYCIFSKNRITTIPQNMHCVPYLDPRLNEILSSEITWMSTNRGLFSCKPVINRSNTDTYCTPVTVSLFFNKLLMDKNLWQSQKVVVTTFPCKPSYELVLTNREQSRYPSWGQCCHASIFIENIEYPSGRYAHSTENLTPIQPFSQITWSGFLLLISGIYFLCSLSRKFSVTWHHL